MNVSLRTYKNNNSVKKNTYHFNISNFAKFDDGLVDSDLIMNLQ